MTMLSKTNLIQKSVLTTIISLRDCRLAALQWIISSRRSFLQRFLCLTQTHCWCCISKSALSQSSDVIANIWPLTADPKQLVRVWIDTQQAPRGKPSESSTASHSGWVGKEAFERWRMCSGAFLCRGIVSLISHHLLFLASHSKKLFFSSLALLVSCFPYERPLCSTRAHFQICAKMLLLRRNSKQQRTHRGELIDCAEMTPPRFTEEHFSMNSQRDTWLCNSSSSISIVLSVRSFKTCESRRQDFDSKTLLNWPSNCPTLASVDGYMSEAHIVDCAVAHLT